MADDGLLPLPGHTEAATTNWLHRRLPGLKLEVVGFRAPMYLAADDRTGYWNQVEDIARTARDRRVIFLGDFNCDPFTDTRPCTQVFPRLQADGFRLPEPKGDWSYHSGNGHGGSRIDHALASPTLAINEARYIYKAGRHLLAGPANGTHPALRPRAALDPGDPLQLTAHRSDDAVQRAATQRASIRIPQNGRRSTRKNDQGPTFRGSAIRRQAMTRRRSVTLSDDREVTPATDTGVV